MIVACMFLLFTKVHVIGVLEKCVQWLEPCSEGWFAVLFTGVCLSTSALIISQIIAKKQHVAHSSMAASLFVVLVYTYFRFVNNDFEFWGVGWYKWCDALYTRAG